ncbi:hypothetical protein EUTSA_v10002764mg, partial [Eutrema salsugineum]
MVDAITGFVVGKMGNSLIKEASMLKGVKDELEELKTELMCIRGYLKDVEVRESENNVSKEWSKLVLDIAYDVENVLDSYDLKAKGRSQRRGLKRSTNKLGKNIDAYNKIDDVRALKRRILDVTRKRQTYGIGKFSEPRARETTSSFRTALARKLYNSAKVKDEFDCRAWTYVSQDYKTIDMLMRIIRSMGMVCDEELERIKMFAEEALEVYLYRLLDGKKYLMVRALPGNHKGSRVIVITCIRTVAEGVDPKTGACFSKNRLGIVNKVMKNCRELEKKWFKNVVGYHFAIVVIAGVMSTKRLWKRLKDNSINISIVFDLSFKELQHELKLCFIYLDMLIQLLIAERFIQEHGMILMEDVSRDYIEELIDRSLMEAMRRERGILMSCRIHDLLRDVAVKKAKEVNFVNVYKEKQSSNTCRREAVHHLMNYKMGDILLNQQMRSFLFFGERGFLRTMESRLPKKIGDLIYLKYLGIGYIYLSCIPIFISKL